MLDLRRQGRAERRVVALFVAATLASSSCGRSESLPVPGRPAPEKAVPNSPRDEVRRDATAAEAPPTPTGKGTITIRASYPDGESCSAFVVLWQIGAPADETLTAGDELLAEVRVDGSVVLEDVPHGQYRVQVLGFDRTPPDVPPVTLSGDSCRIDVKLSRPRPVVRRLHVRNFGGTSGPSEAAWVGFERRYARRSDAMPAWVRLRRDASSGEIVRPRIEAVHGYVIGAWVPPIPLPVRCDADGAYLLGEWDAGHVDSRQSLELRVRGCLPITVLVDTRSDPGTEYFAWAVPASEVAGAEHRVLLPDGTPVLPAGGTVTFAVRAECGFSPEAGASATPPQIEMTATHPECERLTEIRRLGVDGAADWTFRMRRLDADAD